MFLCQVNGSETQWDFCDMYYSRDFKVTFGSPSSIVQKCGLWHLITCTSSKGFPQKLLYQPSPCCIYCKSDSQLYFVEQVQRKMAPQWNALYVVYVLLTCTAFDRHFNTRTLTSPHSIRECYTSGQLSPLPHITNPTSSHRLSSYTLALYNDHKVNRVPLVYIFDMLMQGKAQDCYFIFIFNHNCQFFFFKF